MTVPVHHRHRLPSLDAKARQSAGQTADTLTQRAVGETQLALIGNFLIRRRRQRGMQQLLDQQRVGIGRRRRLDDFHGHSRSR